LNVSDGDEVLISVRNLTYAIAGKTILKDVSFDIRRKDFISIIGPNGAGKTTLLRNLDKILTGGEGEILVKGRDIRHMHQRELAGLISYVPQAQEAHVPFTVWQFVLMGRFPHLSPFSSVSFEDERVAEDVLITVGMTEFRDRRLDTLSGGERQKVFIAASLAQGAEILLLDEPTTFLDPKHQVDIYRILKILSEEGTVTIVIVTHDINHAALVSKKILALRGGEIMYFGGSAGIMDNTVLRSVYGKDFLFVQHPESGIPVIIPGQIK
jgi:iron complex transport system ATP-binding protein